MELRPRDINTELYTDELNERCHVRSTVTDRSIILKRIRVSQ
jgi:hypothetical protein